MNGTPLGNEIDRLRAENQQLRAMNLSAMLTALHTFYGTHDALQNAISNWVVAHPDCRRMDAVHDLYNRNIKE